MFKYKYEYFVANKDLAKFVNESAQIIADAGYDPTLFYETLVKNPDILMMEDEEAINELLGMGKAWDGLKGVGNAFKNIGSKGRAQQQTSQLAYLKSLSPDELAKQGITQQHIDQLEKQQNAAVAQSQNSFGQNFKQGYQQARNDRTMNNIHKQLGIGKYAAPQPWSASQPTAPTPAPQQPTPNPTQPPQPQPQPQPTPQQPTPQPQPQPQQPTPQPNNPQPQQPTNNPTPQSIAFDAQAVVKDLSAMLNGNRGGRLNNKQLVPKLRALLAKLQQQHP
jgi:hypothetical protein